MKGDMHYDEVENRKISFLSSSSGMSFRKGWLSFL